MSKKTFIIIIVLMLSVYSFIFAGSLKADGPVISSIEPNFGINNTPTNITIKGSGFEPTPKVSLYGGGPFKVASFHKSYSMQSVYVSGNYAYVANEDGGLQVIDIANPENPVIVGSCDTPGSDNDFHVAGNYAFVADGYSGLQVIDIANPENPVIVGSCDIPGSASDIHITGNYAYMACGGDGGLQIIELFKPLIDVSYIDSNTITATVPEAFKPGTYNLHVTNPDGEHIIIRNAFTLYQAYYKDHDQDSYGVDNDLMYSVNPINEYTATSGGDCDDTNPAINPDATEKCDGIDNNCDGNIDEEDAEGCRIYYKDADQDRHGVAGDSRCLCSPDTVSQYTALYSGDPDDSNPNILGTILTGHIYLPSGWSMISLTLEPEDSKVSTLFPNSVVMYSYKKGIGYERVKAKASLDVGKGYWILLNEAKAYTITGEIIDEYNLSTQDGWYMIGGCTLDAQVSANNCNSSVIYKYVQGMGYQRIQEGEYLGPGEGYWILLNNVDSEATISVETVD